MHKLKSLSLIAFTGILLLMFTFFVLPISHQHRLHEEQKELANFLNVNIDDYPSPNDFPIGYFDSVLKPGMSYREVHEIVRGYDSAYHCEGEFNYEIYNYFSKNEYTWTILLISYDTAKKFDGHIETSSDPNSRTLGGRACIDGPLR